MSNRLKEIFNSHEGNFVFKWDHYFDIYDRYFNKYCGQPINLLEIGISQGGSLQLWKKYFGDKVNIYAIDYNPQCKKFEEGNIKIFIGSQEDRQFLEDVKKELPDLDIIIDDGGHTMNQQIVSFESLYMKVKEGGIYLVEDTHTSYWYEFQGGLKRASTFIEYSKNLIDSLYEGHMVNRNIKINDITRHINSVAFYDSIVVFEKQKRPQPYPIGKGVETITPFAPSESGIQTFIRKVKNRLFGNRDIKSFQQNKGRTL